MNVTANVDLDAAIEQLEFDIAKIKNQLDEAVSKARTTGEYADPVWWRKAKAALRFKGIEHQRLMRRRAELRRERQGHAEFAQRFVAIAKKQLDPSVFDLISNEAESSAAGGRGGRTEHNFYR